MKITIQLLTLVLVFGFLTIGKSQESTITYESENLKIVQITDNSFIHISYLETETFGKVPCNGLIYLNSNQAVVFDTPTNNPASKELIKWIQSTQKAEIKGVFFNHFHIDCTGGQDALNEAEIPIYAHTKTLELLDNPKGPKVFTEQMSLTVGDEEIVGHHLGEAHTIDNIVCYIPSEELIFGGCMVKSIGAKKGNLEDANIEEWSNTIEKIKREYPNLKTIVPGHGKHGGTELLDYTIELFKTN